MCELSDCRIEKRDNPRLDSHQFEAPVQGPETSLLGQVTLKQFSKKSFWWWPILECYKSPVGDWLAHIYAFSSFSFLYCTLASWMTSNSRQRTPTKSTTLDNPYLDPTSNIETPIEEAILGISLPLMPFKMVFQVVTIKTWAVASEY